MIVVIGDSAGGQLSNLKKSAGGHVLAHATTIRFMFRKANETKISARFSMPLIYVLTCILFVNILPPSYFRCQNWILHKD